MDPLTSMPMTKGTQETLSKIKRDSEEILHDQQQENGLPENEKKEDQKKPVDIKQQNEMELDQKDDDSHSEQQRKTKPILYGAGGLDDVKKNHNVNTAIQEEAVVDFHNYDKTLTQEPLTLKKDNQQFDNTPSISTGEKDKLNELVDVKVRDAGAEPQSKKEINDQTNDGKFEQKPGAILFWGLIVCCAVLMGPMGGGTGLGFVFAPLQLASFAAIPFWKRGTKKTWVPNPSKPTDSLLTTKPGQDGMVTKKPENDAMVTKQQDKDGLTAVQNQKERLLKHQPNGQGLKAEGDKSDDEVNEKGFANNLILMINQLVLSGAMNALSEEDKKIYGAFKEKMEGQDGEKIRQEMFNSVGDKMVEPLHSLMVSENKEESAKEFINVMAEQILEVSKLPEFEDVKLQMQKYVDSIKINEDFRKEFTYNLKDLMKKSQEAGQSLPEYIQSLAGAKNAHQADSVKIDLLQQVAKKESQRTT